MKYFRLDVLHWELVAMYMLGTSHANSVFFKDISVEYSMFKWKHYGNIAYYVFKSIQRFSEVAPLR